MKSKECYTEMETILNDNPCFGTVITEYLDPYAETVKTKGNRRFVLLFESLKHILFRNSPQLNFTNLFQDFSLLWSFLFQLAAAMELLLLLVCKDDFLNLFRVCSRELCNLERMQTRIFGLILWLRNGTKVDWKVKRSWIFIPFRPSWRTWR